MNTNIIIHNINDIRHSHRLCTIQTEHISKSLAPKSIQHYQSKILLYANYLSLQVTKNQEQRETRSKNHQQQTRLKINNLVNAPLSVCIKIESCTMSSAPRPTGLVLAALCTMTYCSPTAHSGTSERIREPSAPVGNEGT